MKWLVGLLQTSIGKKLVMAVTGLLMTGFMLCVHLTLNLLILKGERWYDTPIGLMEKVPGLIVAECGLVALFAAHVLFGIWLQLENLQTAPAGYVARQGAGNRTLGSSTMLYTALFLLVFLTVHVWAFKFGDHSAGYHSMVTKAFSSAATVGFYMVGAIALYVHMSHGVASAFQTLGLTHPNYTPLVKLIGFLVALSMLGFAGIAGWSFMRGGR
jgi:succinate dehydrogenase / fumarate reductase cytochrome b subunit